MNNNISKGWCGMKNKYLVFIFISSTFITINTMENDESPSLGNQTLKQRLEKPISFATTTVIPIVVSTLSGSYAVKGLHNIGFQGERNFPSIAFTILSGALALGCGYITYEYSYKQPPPPKEQPVMLERYSIKQLEKYLLHFNATSPEELRNIIKTHQLFGWGRNKIHDYWEDLKERAIHPRDADHSTLFELIKGYPDDLKGYLEDAKYIIKIIMKSKSEGEHIHHILRFGEKLSKYLKK
jgi:hypothetical protein